MFYLNPVQALKVMLWPYSQSVILHLLWQNLRKCHIFLREGLGAELVYGSAERKLSLSHERFYNLGGVWIAAMHGEPPWERSYRHLEFYMGQSELQESECRFGCIGIETKPPRLRVEEEGQSL